MNPFGISEKSYNLMKATLVQYSEIESVILFGSRAKGNYTHGSDIDIAIKGKKPRPNWHSTSVLNLMKNYRFLTMLM